MTDAMIGFGKDAAAAVGRFVTAYRLVKTERGVLMDGASPDGRVVGTCDRCGTAIMNVYVFSNTDRSVFMHVGIDCAGKMGIPVDQLRSARSYWRDVAREEANRLSRLSADERRRKEEDAVAMRLAAAADLVEDIRSMLSNPNLSDWERSRLNTMLAYTGQNTDSWFYDPECDDDDRNLRQYFGIRDRLALCATSKPVVAKTYTGRLRAYRDPMGFDGMYGTSYMNFLTDDDGNAFMYKGSHRYECGAFVTATWTIDGDSSYGGLVSTTLKRPRKGTVQTREGETFPL